MHYLLQLGRCLSRESSLSLNCWVWPSSCEYSTPCCRMQLISLLISESLLSRLQRCCFCYRSLDFSRMNLYVIRKQFLFG